ncbi:VPLPA-CTERM sorting domain-containing protein [Roseovarius sp. D22-M7]|uniref:VPLPA-CTERM sorting domain-containing protein n=1 Tax=Roseovarius sp. D22-M7 TaxID=3127116 RepID=UPI00300FE8D7
MQTHIRLSMATRMCPRQRPRDAQWNRKGLIFMTYLYKTLGLAAAATLALATTGATGAQAASITVQSFSPGAFIGLAKSDTVIEDFETPGALTKTFEGGGTGLGTAPDTYGELAAGTALGSKVGSFTGLGGTGKGNTCQNLSIGNATCDNIALQFDSTLNGQSNIVPDEGKWSINAADTKGIEWTAFLPGDRQFTSLFFAIRDAADQGAKLTVAAAGQSVELTDLLNNGNRLGNNNEQLIFVDFGTAVDSALITMSSSKINDSFSIDGAAITPVPLPAAGWLMIAGLGGLAALRRRKRAA